MKSIRSTVKKAIDASRPEMGTQISDSRQAVRNVSESQDNYCDSSAEAELVLAVPGDSTGVSIWVPIGEWKVTSRYQSWGKMW
jgi:hypothetical protein